MRRRVVFVPPLQHTKFNEWPASQLTVRGCATYRSCIFTPYVLAAAAVVRWELWQAVASGCIHPGK
jgi:hypothetical protein